MGAKQRYTISKDVAESLQLQGWELVESFYDNGYQCTIYHLEAKEPSNI